MFLADVVKGTIYNLKSQYSMRCQEKKMISCEQRLMHKNSNFRLNGKKYGTSL